MRERVRGTTPDIAPFPAAREAELRRLRKMNTEFEEQNAILQKHTESMNCAKEKLEQELAQEERQTLALQQQLQSVRQALTASFASLPIPGEFGAAVGTSLLLGPGGCAETHRGGLINACLLMGWEPGHFGGLSGEPKDVTAPCNGVGQAGNCPLEPWSQLCPQTPFVPGPVSTRLSPAAGDGTYSSGSLPQSPAGWGLAGPANWASVSQALGKPPR